jgi:predicted acyl esterase
MTPPDQKRNVNLAPGHPARTRHHRLADGIRLSFLFLVLVSQVLCAKTELVRLPMRDGVKLATDVYLPDQEGPFPVVFIRTPYNRVMGAGFAPEAAKRGIVLVVQDTRGRFASEGDNFAFDADAWGERQDGLDTINWIVKQPWCNGKIGTFGGSALSITTLLLAGTGTPHLEAQVLPVGAPNLYEVVYKGGVFRKSLVEDWIRISKFSPGALALWVSHPAYDDYWKHRDLTGRYSRINAAAVHLGGWYDIFAQGTIDSFKGYQYRGGPRARGRQKLIMGPWTHGILTEKSGQLTFPKANKPPSRATDSWSWLETHLKGIDPGFDQEPAITYYVMGDAFDKTAPGNVWRTSKIWPLPEARQLKYFLHADRSLSIQKPGTDSPLGFTYDPRNPSPTVGGIQLSIPAGPMEQSKVESRSDVLLFSTGPIVEPVEVTGRVQARLWIASDCPDTDFILQLCDVYPDDRSFNVCEGALRVRFRGGFRKEKLMKSGRVYPIDIDLWSTSIIFNRGHKIRLQVRSSSVPGYDPNPNTGATFRSNEEIRVARNSIFVDRSRPSHLILPVVPARLMHGNSSPQ